MDLHDLTAAYALDALDADETEAYERHLAQCAQCREQLAELNETAGALAFAAVAPEPPPQLRSAILATASAERTNVVPLPRRRWVARGLAVAAAVAACVAVGFAVSALKSGPSRLVVVVKLGPHRGRGTLQVKGLGAAPQGKTYEAWVIPPGRPPRPAGLFPGGEGTFLVRLGGVPPHSVVAVTLERAGGVRTPTSPPLIKTST
ncbi:MAG TPA: anti-sigma factor [Thermoanaerobaculia bacterium]|nr:anti-sigma factor [Thermoanaerobaculia bacterium]